MYTQFERDLIAQAKTIVRSKAITYDVTKPCFDKAAVSRDYVYLELADKDREEFHVLFLTSQHHLIESQQLFAGTLNQSAVFPREIARYALLHNAHAVILFHNHPSGVAIPSRADENITTLIVDALRLIDIRVLDHLIVGDSDVYSFAENGLL